MASRLRNWLVIRTPGREVSFLIVQCLSRALSRESTASLEGDAVPRLRPQRSPLVATTAALAAAAPAAAAAVAAAAAPTPEAAAAAAALRALLGLVHSEGASLEHRAVH